MAKLSQSVVILAAKRTAFGTMQGALKALSATDLGVHAAKAALDQSKVPADEIAHVVIGNVMQTSADAIYCARHVGLKAGLPITTPARHREPPLRLGLPGDHPGGGAAPPRRGGGGPRRRNREHDAGAARPARGARRLGVRQGARGRGLALVRADRQLLQHADGRDRGEPRARSTASRRQQCDEYALSSQQRWAAANEKGLFKDEIAPIELTSKKGTDHLRGRRAPAPAVDARDARRSWLRSSRRTASSRRGTRRAFATARRASSSRRRTSPSGSGLKPLARIVQWGVAGVEPSLMGIGPAPAIKSALERASLKLSDMDLVEVNEAFAPQYLAVEKELGLDRAKTNVNGGAIALGHPLGASGARITAHLVYELARRKRALRSGQRVHRRRAGDRGGDRAGVASRASRRHCPAPFTRSAPPRPPPRSRGEEDRRDRRATSLRAGRHVEGVARGDGRRVEAEVAHARRALGRAVRAALRVQVERRCRRRAIRGLELVADHQQRPLVLGQIRGRCPTACCSRR